jgi:hypothetical protein
MTLNVILTLGKKFFTLMLAVFFNILKVINSQLAIYEIGTEVVSAARGITKQFSHRRSVEPTSFPFVFR